MNNKKIICLIVGILIIFGIVMFFIFREKSKFDVNKSNNYLIVTDEQFATMQDDGGSHYNRYYQISLDEKIVRKCEDSYVGFKGYEYKGKTIYKKKIDNQMADEIKSVLDNILLNDDVNDSNNYSYYIISTVNYNEEKIYNKNSISEIRKILTKLDNL